MKKTNIRRSTMAIGILALIAVVFSQFFHSQAHEKISKKATTEQNDDTEDEEYISLPSSSLPASTHIELNRDVFFLFETLLVEGDVDAINNLPSIPLKNLFEFLIGSFISPNAP